MSSPLATVGILSIGEMGMGVAKLLIAHNYRVVTNVEGRSQDTRDRALKSSIECLPTDESLVLEADYILSIVPPRDAHATALRIVTALSKLSTPKPTPLYYLDLNAIAPSTARSIAKLFPAEACFIDGGIIGGAPRLKSDVTTPSTTVSVIPSSTSTSTTANLWTRPSIPISGPHPLTLAPVSGSQLASLLNTNYLSDQIGTASGLKCCFASVGKGFIALCVQAFTSAEKLGVLGELTREMSGRFPGLWNAAQGIKGMPPKAYRWVAEMEEIGRCHGEWGFVGGEEEDRGVKEKVEADGRDGDGGEGKGKGGEKGKGVFGEIAEVYRVIAEETVLGEEKTEVRKRGLTVDDVAVCVGEGLDRKRARRE